MRTAEGATDADLLVAASADATAFEAFYRRYVRRVAAFAVAQTFVRLLGAAERYDPERAEPAPFVLGIAANVIRDQQRRLDPPVAGPPARPHPGDDRRGVRRCVVRFPTSWPCPTSRTGCGRSWC
jgi:DNA-directed RNA polymerase specialized sigma24 family protein